MFLLLWRAVAPEVWGAGIKSDESTWQYLVLLANNSDDWFSFLLGVDLAFFLLLSALMIHCVYCTHCSLIEMLLLINTVINVTRIFSGSKSICYLSKGSSRAVVTPVDALIAVLQENCPRT